MAASASTPFLSCCKRALATQAAATRAAVPSGRKPIHRRVRQQAVETAGVKTQAFGMRTSTSTAQQSYSPATSTSQDSSTRDLAGATFFQPDPTKVTSHLNALLEGLDPPLPSELAMRMVTHKGAISPNASSEKSQHNARLSFLGRRILRLYLSIFYHAHATLLDTARRQGASSASASAPAPSRSAPAIPNQLKLCEDTLEEALNTYSLGRNVAMRWELEDNMRWRQMIGRDGRPTGLIKISGQAVEAILGGIFRQYGAAVALQVFNSRILPFLALPHELRHPAVQLAKAHGDLSANAQAALQQQQTEVLSREDTAS